MIAATNSKQTSEVVQVARQILTTVARGSY